MPPKKSSTKKKSTGPKYADMIYDAIDTLKVRGGASRQAIKAFVLDNYGKKINQTAFPVQFRAALKRGVESGALIQSGQSFRLSESSKRRGSIKSASGSKKGSKKATKTGSKKASTKKKSTTKKKASTKKGSKKATTKKASKPKKKTVAKKKTAAKKKSTPKKKPATKKKAASKKKASTKKKTTKRSSKK